MTRDVVLPTRLGIAEKPEGRRVLSREVLLDLEALATVDRVNAPHIQLAYVREWLETLAGIR